MLRKLTITTLSALLLASPALAQSSTSQDDREVLDVALVDSELRVIWATYCATLKAGNAQGAAEFHIPSNRKSWLQLYELLGEHIKTMPENWSDLTLIEVSNPFAKYALNDNSSGLLHTVTFLRYPDGTWLIQGM